MIKKDDFIMRIMQDSFSHDYVMNSIKFKRKVQAEKCEKINTTLCKFSNFLIDGRNEEI